MTPPRRPEPGETRSATPRRHPRAGQRDSVRAASSRPRHLGVKSLRGAGLGSRPARIGLPRGSSRLFASLAILFDKPSPLRRSARRTTGRVERIGPRRHGAVTERRTVNGHTKLLEREIHNLPKGDTRIRCRRRALRKTGPSCCADRGNRRGAVESAKVQLRVHDAGFGASRIDMNAVESAASIRPDGADRAAVMLARSTCARCVPCLSSGRLTQARRDAVMPYPPGEGRPCRRRSTTSGADGQEAAFRRLMAVRRERAFADATEDRQFTTSTARRGAHPVRRHGGARICRWRAARWRRTRC